MILERPFLATEKEKIDLETGELISKFNKEKVFNVYQWKPYVEDLERCYKLEEKDSKVHKRMKEEVFYRRESTPYAWCVLSIERQAIEGK